MQHARPMRPQARRVRPAAGPTDRRRLLAAGLSAVLPGLGQLLNGRVRLARWFLLPSVAVLGAAWLLFQVVSVPRLVATAVGPTVLTLLLLLNLLALGWRVSSVAQAFLDRRFPGAPGRLGAGGLVAILVVTAVPHLFAWQYGLAAQGAFGKIFGTVAGAEGTPPPAGPGYDERINVLLIGIDKTAWRTATLTDTLMVASLDPVGRTVSLVSIPRDTVNVPLGNGDVYGPKLNSLMSYADRNPAAFPDGGHMALRRAVGALLGIPIHYEATMDFEGFRHMIDAVGGIDIDVKEGFEDPTYDGYGFQGKGWSVKAGPNHFNGYEALAYARSRKASGESDFTRQQRQQEILLALRAKVTRSGSLVFNLPALLTALGDTVRTDFPLDRLADVAALVDEVDNGDLVRVVIRAPLVKGMRNEYGSVQVPDVAAIQAMARGAFSTPGTDPVPWPTPKPSPLPSGSPAAP